MIFICDIPTIGNAYSLDLAKDTKIYPQSP